MILRAWSQDDVSTLAEAWVDPEIAAGAVPGDPPDEAAAATWIAGGADRRAHGRAIDWVVVEPASARPDQVRGEVGLWRLSPERAVVEVGWWIRAEDRGRGLATAAVASALGWARPALRPEAVVARIGVAHTASERVAEAVGMVPVGLLGDGRRLWRTP